MRSIRTTLTILAAGALLAGGLAAPAQADDVPPVARISCASAAAVSAAWGTSVVLHSSSPTQCAYRETGGDHTTGFTVSVHVGTPAEDKAQIAADWPEDYPYPFQTTPVPELGPEAFVWGDASPGQYHWTFAPGAVAVMSSDFRAESYHIATAKLFKPMMEVYTIPGERTVNGRDWRTTCEKYSATERCRTEIKATVIKLDGGRYVRTDGWAFNSLTYRWSPRAMWKGNPLGNTNAGWTAADGRKWRTECDTAATGRGACRSYIEATVVSWTGSSYRQETKWIFNNQVLFTD